MRRNPKIQIPNLKKIPNGKIPKHANRQSCKTSGRPKGVWSLGFGIFLGFGTWFFGFSLTGCVTKAKAREQGRAAFMAGQQSAMMRMSQPQKPVVTFIGQVQIPSLPWTEGLTLARAIIAAVYTGKDPKQILIVRGGQAVPVDPRQLLNGEDIPLQSGDLVQILQ